MELDAFEVDKLFLFIAFVIPGFITLKFYELINYKDTAQDSSTKIVDAITYSCINYAVLSFFIYEVEISKFSAVHPKLYILFYIFVVLISPILLAFIWKKIRLSAFFQKNAAHPTTLPWDYVFSQRKSYWVVVTLADDKKIAGLYAGNSFTSSYPAEAQIYLEQEWILKPDGEFERMVNNSAGVIILSKDIKTIEFFSHS